MNAQAQGEVPKQHFAVPYPLHAFQAVLRRKQSAYKGTLAKLHEEMKLPRYRHLHTQLATVVAPSKSVCFQDIQF